VTEDAEVERLTDALVTASRALVAIAVRSVGAAPVEITLPQHRVLVLLAAHGEQAVGVLAEQLGVNASNASRVCDRLQRLGLVTRRRSTADARSVGVALTEQGVEVLRVVGDNRREEVRRVLGTMELADSRATVDALRRFNDAAHEVADSDWALLGSVRGPVDGPVALADGSGLEL
jgi:DNA-binding MarR family transcriptional regulator